jgi:hypothetical protein
MPAPPLVGRLGMQRLQDSKKGIEGTTASVLLLLLIFGRV